MKGFNAAPLSEMEKLQYRIDMLEVENKTILDRLTKQEDAIVTMLRHLTFMITTMGNEND